MASHPSVFTQVVREYRRGWKQLALTDLIYKMIAFVLLTPLVGVLFRIVLAFSGNTVLADQDILFFLIGPLGGLCLIAVGGLSLGIVALEQAALLAVLYAGHKRQRISLTAALRFARTNSWRVIRVAGRMVFLTLLTAIPFLAIAGIVYSTMLSKFDINYYLQNKPPVFLIALGIGGLLAVTLIVVLLRLFTSWFFALTLVLFEDVRPSNALRASAERTRGQRRQILLWIIGWFATTALLSALATSLVVSIGQWFVPLATGSLAMLAAAVGVTLLFSAVANLGINLLSTTSFATVLWNLYRQNAGDNVLDVSSLKTADQETGRSAFRWTRTRLLAVGVVGVLAAMTFGVVAMRTVRLDDEVQIIAHRGSSAAAPENTMAAIQQAIEDGTDWVEIDVQETADGEVVVFHDSDFMKLAGKPLRIWDATVADLETIDIGSWFGPEFKDERVPTLAQVLRECKDKAGVTIELKYYGHDQRLEQRVAELVEGQGMADQIVVMSLKIDAVRKMKKLRSEWRVGLLMSVSAGDMQSAGPDFLAVNASFANRAFISSAHKQGRDVYVWTVNDAPTMSTLIGRGVDGLITDKPALARSVLAQRALMSPVERLLLEFAEFLGVAPEIGEA